MLSILTSASLQGIYAEPVMVEVNTGESGTPEIILVGLPDAGVKESEDRVRTAIGNSGFQMPRLRTTVNLAPGSLRKEGPMYDLPIALGILSATEQLISDQIEQFLIVGELSLSGATRPVRGALAYARLARQLGKRGVVLPEHSACEAALVDGIEVFAVDSLDRAVRFFKGEELLAPLDADMIRKPAPDTGTAGDFGEIKGQGALRRAVEVAVSGGHNLLMIGSPGGGKSMVAKRIPTIMPPPSNDEFLEILSIHSAAGRTLNGDIHWGSRPFRAPHHTVSDVALLGGGVETT